MLPGFSASNNFLISILCYKRVADLSCRYNNLDRTVGKNNYYLLGITQQFACYPQSITIVIFYLSGLNALSHRRKLITRC